MKQAVRRKIYPVLGNCRREGAAAVDPRRTRPSLSLRFGDAPNEERVNKPVT
jgi:hypothetical protein